MTAVKGVFGEHSVSYFHKEVHGPVKQGLSGHLIL